jgi:ATP phosphoribosyltransferase
MASTPATTTPSPVQIHLALPKGHMQENVFKLFEDSGLKVNLGVARGYRPTVPLENYDVKLLKVLSNAFHRL